PRVSNSRASLKVPRSRANRGAWGEPTGHPAPRAAMGRPSVSRARRLPAPREAARLGAFDRARAAARRAGAREVAPELHVVDPLGRVRVSCGAVDRGLDEKAERQPDVGARSRPMVVHDRLALRSEQEATVRTSGVVEEDLDREPRADGHLRTD